MLDALTLNAPTVSDSYRKRLKKGVPPGRDLLESTAGGEPPRFCPLLAIVARRPGSRCLPA